MIPKLRKSALISPLSIWFALNILLWPFFISTIAGSLRLNTLASIPFAIIYLYQRRKIKLTSVWFSVGCLVFVLLSIVIATTGLCEDGHSKAVATSIPLIFMFIVSYEVGASSREADWLLLPKISRYILLIITLSVVVEIVFPSLFSPQKFKYHQTLKYSGLFAEPSHLAGGIFPCILILFNSKLQRDRYWSIFFLTFFFTFSRSSSLVLHLVTWLAYLVMSSGTWARRIRLGLAVFIIGLFIYTFGSELVVNPIVERIAGLINSEETDNLTSLVYLKGFQDGIENLTRTNGWGLGFNMMGCTPLPLVSARVIFYLGHTQFMQLNDYDGSFLLSKMMSEFGLVAFFLLFICFHLWWKNAKLISRFHSSSYKIALLLCFFLQVFFRGTVYFQGTVVLILSAFGSHASIRPKTNHSKNAE